MAITVTLKDSTEDTDGAGTQTRTSGSFTPESNSRVFVFCGVEKANHSTAFSFSCTDSVDGSGGWIKDTETAAYAWGNQSNFHTASVLFYNDFGVGAASRTVTIDPFATADLGFFALMVFSVTGHYITRALGIPDSSFKQPRTTNGANINPAVSNASGTLTLGVAPVSGNTVVAMFAAAGDLVAPCSVPTGYTDLVSQDNIYIHGSVFYHQSTTTAAVTSSDLGDTVGNWAGIIMEVIPAQETTSPTLVYKNSTSWNSTAASKTMTGITVQPNDLIVVSAAKENASVKLTASNTGGGGMSFTERVYQPGTTDANRAEAIVWTATADGNKTIDITVSLSSGTAQYGFNVQVWRNGTVGITFGNNSGTNGAAPTATATTQAANSAIQMIVADWSAQDGSSRTYDQGTAGSFIETDYTLSGGAYTIYDGYYINPGAAASETIGILTPNTQRYVLAGVEIKYASPPAYNTAWVKG